ncbi:hypothetical protein PI125_g21328 [Phytophthora idaei]|nr:hypothetical protein PI125_g21328 [Phytophthora idaei]
MASPSSSVDPCSLQGSLGSPVVISNGKTSLKKSDLTSHSKPQVDLVVNNNEEEIVQQRRRSHARLQRNKELAAKLLQRHVQVWLLKRQETMRVQEVQRLRGELRKAAVCVIEESYARYVKRRAIHSYLRELGNFETRLDELLRRCLICKQQMEVVQ